MAGGEYTILVTDRYLDLVGDPIVNWVGLDVTLRFNEPSSGQVTVPGSPIVDSMLQPGNRVVVIRTVLTTNGYMSDNLIAGPIESWITERSDDGDNAGPGKVTIHFADDLASIVARTAYPNVTATPENQNIDNWALIGNAEGIIRALADYSGGPSARPERRIPQLVIANPAGVGTAIEVQAQRMQPIGDVLREAASVGGGLGFRTKQVDKQIVFQVYAPPDRSGKVRFGFGLGNMKYLSVEVQAPTATTAIVGGQGEGADRYLIARTNTADEAAWGRFETLVSRPGNGLLQDLQDDGDKALASGAPTTRVTTNVIDTPDQQFGVHYQLGDRVGVETTPGHGYTDLIQTVHLQAWPTAGEIFAPTIGSQAAKSDPIWVQRLRAIDDRVGQLERTVKPAVLPP